jgi:hypothetical protein
MLPSWGYTVALDPEDSSVVYAGSDTGLYKSVDAGGSWARVLARDIYSLALPPESPGTIIGADYDSTFYYGTPTVSHRSADGGASWSESSTNIFIEPGSLEADPGDPAVLYAGSMGIVGGVHKSVDQGLTWQPLGGQHMGPVSDVVLDPRNSRTMYASAAEGEVFRSIDGGVTWTPFGEGLRAPGLGALAIDATGTRLHVTGDLGLLYSYQIHSGAADLSVAPDGRTHLLLVSPDHLASLRRFDDAGSSADGGSRARAGWDAKAVATGSDGLDRVLWSRSDGAVALEVPGPGGFLFQEFGVEGWTALDLSAGPDDMLTILWTNVDGRVALWDMDSSGERVDGAVFGPYDGWMARAVSHGMDGRARILWTHTDRRVGLSTVENGQIVSTVRYTPPAGWSARDLTMASDGHARVVLVHDDRRMSLLTIRDDGAVFAGPAYAPPVAGQSAIRAAGGLDGVTRVVWTSSDGVGTLFLLGPDNGLRSSFGLN